MAEDIQYTVEASAGLNSWASGPVLESVQDLGDGTSIYLYRDSEPLAGSERRFLRLLVAKK